MENCGKKKKKNRSEDDISLIRRTFKKLPYSLVPLDLWKVVVPKTALKTLGILAQLSKGFAELVENLRNTLQYALRYRTRDQIRLARACLQNAASHGDSRAMVHLGYALQSNSDSWGIEKDHKKAVHWFRKAAEEHGDTTAMAFYANILSSTIEGCPTADVLIQKIQTALPLNYFAIGYCHFAGLLANKVPFQFFCLADPQDEFVQDFMGFCYFHGVGVKEDNQEALVWYTKAAENGSASAQRQLSHMYFCGYGCVMPNLKLFRYWRQRSSRQRFF